jgi:hypothetical protein
LAAAVELADALVLENFSFFFGPFVIIGLDLVVEVSDVHFFDREIGVEVFAEIVIHLWFFDPQVLIFEVFPVSRSFLMVKFSVVDKLIFLLHLLVPVGFALTIADLGLGKEILILGGG